MNPALERRVAPLILNGDSFSTNELTDDGQIVLDPAHAQSGKQSGIGAFINAMARRGLIEFTGQIVKSTAPHRKSGMVRVWRGTEAGRLWAALFHQCICTMPLEPWEPSCELHAAFELHSSGIFWSW